MYSRACTADLSHCRLDSLLDQTCLEKLHEAVLARYEWLSKYMRGQMCRRGDPRCFDRRDLNAWAMDCPGLIVDADMVDKAARESGRDIFHLYYTTNRVQQVWDKVKEARHARTGTRNYVPESDGERVSDHNRPSNSGRRVRFAQERNDHGEHMSRAEFLEFLVRLSVDKHAPAFAKVGGKHYWNGDPHVAGDAFDALLDLHLEHRIGHIISDDGSDEDRYAFSMLFLFCPSSSPGFLTQVFFFLSFLRTSSCNGLCFFLRVLWLSLCTQSG